MSVLLAVKLEGEGGEERGWDKGCEGTTAIVNGNSVVGKVDILESGLAK